MNVRNPSPIWNGCARQADPAARRKSKLSKICLRIHAPRRSRNFRFSSQESSQRFACAGRDKNAVAAICGWKKSRSDLEEYKPCLSDRSYAAGSSSIRPEMIATGQRLVLLESPSCAQTLFASIIPIRSDRNDEEIPIIFAGSPHLSSDRGMSQRERGLIYRAIEELGARYTLSCRMISKTEHARVLCAKSISPKALRASPTRANISCSRNFSRCKW